MNGMHDVAGMHGFGPLSIEPDEPVFYARWHGVVTAIAERLVEPGLYGNDSQFRYAIEKMSPRDYLETGYYTKWLRAIEEVLLYSGAITAEELVDGRAMQAPSKPHRRSDPPQAVLAKFQAGDAVVARVINAPKHTRMPRYVRGKRWLVRFQLGPQLFPEAGVVGDEAWEHCYAVEFDAHELWGEEAFGGGSVCVDLWESYLMEGQDMSEEQGVGE